MRDCTVDSRRRRKKRAREAMAWKPPVICPNCGREGKHYAPPSFGEEGFYACASFPDTPEKK